MFQTPFGSIVSNIEQGLFTDWGLNASSIEVIVNPELPVWEVEIDIKPGSYPNSINLGSQGVIPVAIFSTDIFDATTVNPETVMLAGANVAVRGKSGKLMAHTGDVDGDGLDDLLLQVATEGIDVETIEEGYAILAGETYDGLYIMGMDEITIVPKEK